MYQLLLGSTHVDLILLQPLHLGRRSHLVGSSSRGTVGSRAISRSTVEGYCRGTVGRAISRGTVEGSSRGTVGRASSSRVLEDRASKLSSRYPIQWWSWSSRR